MRKICSNIVGLLFCTLFVAGCEKEFTLKNDIDNKLVIISNFSPRQNIKVNVSLAKPIFEEAFFDATIPRNAQIELFENGNFVERLRLNDTFRSTPFYESDYIIQENKDYSLRGSLDNFESISASNKIPSAMIFDDIKSIDTSSTLDPTTGLSDALLVDFSIQLSSSIESEFHYHINIFKNSDVIEVINFDTIIIDQITEELSASLINMNGISLLHETGILIESNSPINTQGKITLSTEVLKTDVNEVFSSLTVELRTVTEDYYLFHRNISEQEATFNSKGLFLNAALIHNNIQGGIGNFGAFNSYSFTIPLK